MQQRSMEQLVDGTAGRTQPSVQEEGRCMYVCERACDVCSLQESNLPWAIARQVQQRTVSDCGDGHQGKSLGR